MSINKSWLWMEDVPSFLDANNCMNMYKNIELKKSF